MGPLITLVPQSKTFPLDNTAGVCFPMIILHQHTRQILERGLGAGA
jgi:hypothetical protein